MKLDIKTIITIVSLLILGLVVGYVFKKDAPQPPEQPLGATGSKFHIETEWMQRNPLDITNALATTTTTAVATTSPVYLAENASTTIDIVTSGVSDLRLNLNVNSTTTLPFITILQQVIGTVTDADDLGNVDYYTESSVTSGSVAITPNTSWQIATTTTSDVSRASILLTNINSPKIRFIIGMTDAVTGTTGGMEFNLEFLKVRPN